MARVFVYTDSDIEKQFHILIDFEVSYLLISLAFSAAEYSMLLARCRVPLDIGEKMLRPGHASDSPELPFERDQNRRTSSG